MSASDQQDELALLEQTARDMLGDVAGEDSAKVWQVLASAELPLLAVPEPAGGGWLAAAAAVARIAGELGADVPYADAAIVAAPMLAAVDLPLPSGLVVGATGDVTVGKDGDGFRLRGTISRVPWGASAERIVCVADGFAVSLDPSLAQATEGRNIA